MSIFPSRRRIERRLKQFCTPAPCPLGGDHSLHFETAGSIENGEVTIVRFPVCRQARTK